MNTTLQKLEAYLFYKGEPVSVTELARVLEVSQTDCATAIAELLKNLEGRGVTLLQHNNKVSLRTSALVSDFISELEKDELSKDLGKAALETLSIVLYKSPVARSEIDYIRGVNSSFILRNLSIRGLLERIPNPQDQRGYLYRPTDELLAHLGVTSLSDLPNRENVLSQLKQCLDSENHE